MITAPAEVRRIASLFPSFRDFVDDALFHPTWGYYSTGKVRFGEGGHYDTFPLSLSPLFGRMVAEYAYRFWRRAGQPGAFEICELGAGNGQLCLDVQLRIRERARAARSWSRFAAAFRYRVIERSSGLMARQRQHLGPLADSVRWTRADLAQRPVRGAPFGPCGIVFANEVLDCLAHHKVVPQADGTPGVAFVVPALARKARLRRGAVDLARGTDGDERAVPRAELAKVLGDDRLRRHVTFNEVLLPVQIVPALHLFLLRHYPEFFARGTKCPPSFACPAIDTLVGNTAHLYRVSEVLWIDYGETVSFHLRAPERRKVFAGPPRSGATVYRAPGLDDITFLVDFSVVGAATEEAGLRVKFYGEQGELARRSGVQIDRAARDLILRYRALSWLLALVGVGPERAWRHTSLTWSKETGKGGSLRSDVSRSAAEFLGERSSNFKLLIAG